MNTADMKSKTKVITEAKSLLDKYHYCVPFNLEQAVEDKGFLIEYEDLDDSISGMLITKKNVICINKNHHPNRQRFTLAHELGHLVLHSTQNDLFIDESLVYYRDKNSAEGLDQCEIEANTFAAEILMPEKALKTRIAGQKIDMHDDFALKKLASEFEVSVQALTIRLTRLKLITDY